MAGLVPAIHAFGAWRLKFVDARHKAGHDERDLGAQWCSRDASLVRALWFSSSSHDEGMARRKAQVLMVRALCGARGRLSARHERRLCDRRAALRKRSANKPPQVVSRLLAGGLSTSGRNPGAARVPGLRTRPAGIAPRPASRRLAKRPSSGQGDTRIEALLGAGISFLAQLRPASRERLECAARREFRARRRNRGWRQVRREWLPRPRGVSLWQESEPAG